MADDAKFPTDMLLAWGREWQRHLEAGPGHGDFQLHWPLLTQYVARANEALAQMIQRPSRRQKGRPRGSGLAGQVIALVATGTPEEQAVRLVATIRKTTVEKVVRAYRRAAKDRTKNF
jgi:hypothetical protein